MLQHCTGTFQHMQVHFGTVSKCPCAETSILLCMVPKYPSVETYPHRNVPCRKVPVSKSSSAEMSPCRKIHVSKNTRVEKSPCRNVHGDEMFICCNFHGAKKSLLSKRSHDEMSVLKYLFTKCQVPKQDQANYIFNFQQRRQQIG